MADDLNYMFDGCREVAGYVPLASVLLSFPGRLFLAVCGDEAGSAKARSETGTPVGRFARRVTAGTRPSLVGLAQLMEG